MVPSMAQLHSLGQDDQNEVQNYFFGYVTSLAQVSSSYNADSAINGTIAF